jgi:1,2-diacylglycerol 3-alpha-glucosyltransferase
MKIAIFTDTYKPYVSGVTTHIGILKEGLEKRGHQVMITTVDPMVEDYVFEDNVLYCPGRAVKKIYGYGITNPLSFHRLDIIRDFDPDVIHIQTEFAIGMFGLWASRRLKKPVVYTLHTMYDDYTDYVFPHYADRLGKSIAHRYFHVIACRADEIIVPSKKAVTFLENCRVVRDVNFIPNVAAVPECPEEKVEEIKEKLGLSSCEAVLCFAGRMGREKSVDVLLSYFRKLVSAHPSVKLILVGGRPEEENLKGYAKELGISENVYFTGVIAHEDVVPYFYASDLYVTASTSEMNSISMLEGMSSGLMTLQRLDESNRYQIVSGTNGWTYETEDEFCSLVDGYLEKSPGERAQLKEDLRTYMKTYGLDEFLDKTLSVYEKVRSK